MKQKKTRDKLERLKKKFWLTKFTEMRRNHTAIRVEHKRSL